MLDEQIKKLFQFNYCLMRWLSHFASLNWKIDEELKRMQTLKPMFDEYHDYLVRIQATIDSELKESLNNQLPKVALEEESTDNNSLDDSWIKIQKSEQKILQSDLITKEQAPDVYTDFQTIDQVNPETLETLRNQENASLEFQSFSSGITDGLANIPRTSTISSVSDLIKPDEVSLLVEYNEFEEAKEKCVDADLTVQPMQLEEKETRWDSLRNRTTKWDVPKTVSPHRYPIRKSFKNNYRVHLTNFKSKQKFQPGKNKVVHQYFYNHNNMNKKKNNIMKLIDINSNNEQ